jgi:hypothetical protein
VWLGGAVTLFAAVAPGAFALLPTPALAGSIVGHVIRFLDLFALAAAPVLIATAVLDERSRGNPTAVWVRASILVAHAVIAAVSRFALVPRMDELRAMRGAPEAVAQPWFGRAEFGTLHGISTLLFGVAILCALLALWFAVRRRPLAEALSVEDAKGDGAG